MNCPNCKSEVSKRDNKCDYCGINLKLYKKIQRASKLYYNNGLSRAKVRDLSGAITALKYSLELNKENVDARNLLGLIYFEVGETVSALSEWVISKHFKSEDNDADRYIDAVQANPTMLDSLNQAVKRYNRALTFAKQASDDLAIIQLKRVISLNPRFIKAYQLLALLYMKNLDNDRAKKYLYQAAEIDVSNTITLRYMKEIMPVGQVHKTDWNKGRDNDVSSTIVPVSSYQEDKPNIMAFVNLVIGIILGLAVMAILIIPSMEGKEDAGQTGDDIDYSASLEKYQQQEYLIQTLEDDKEELTRQVNSLQAQIDKIEAPSHNPNIYDSLFKAIDVYNEEMDKQERDRDYQTISDHLVTIDESQYEADAANDLLESLRQEIYPKVMDTYYGLGHDLYSDYKYEEALEAFEKALEVNPKHVDSIYFMARAYHRLEDYENAALFYENIINDFSDSRRLENSEMFLEEITEALSRE